MTPLPTRLAHALAALSVLALVACSNADGAGGGPAEVTRDTACSLDGMTLMDYPGPKAQIHYEKGDPDFFCDTIEMFAVFLKPEQVKAVRALYVQDMGRAEWTQPEGHWTDAKTAFYVVGSKRRGSMGPTIASYSREEDARALVGREGGRVLRFAEVTPARTTLHGGVHDDRTGY
jgi:copper chaperone NosL